MKKMLDNKYKLLCHSKDSNPLDLHDIEVKRAKFSWNIHLPKCTAYPEGKHRVYVSNKSQGM